MSDKNHGLFQGSGRQDQHPRDPQKKNNPGKEPDKVVFRDDQNRLRRELLVDDAHDWAYRIAKRVSYTQLRKFYSEALALKSRMEEKVKDKGKEEGFKEMEALVGMLISKANYSKIKSRYYARDKIYENEELFNFIYACVTAVHSEQDFKDFILFFEAVLGFFPRKN
jgi:CRISPR type III-A-associated protein Csm2